MPEEKPRPDPFPHPSTEQCRVCGHLKDEHEGPELCCPGTGADPKYVFQPRPHPAERR